MGRNRRKLGRVTGTLTDAETGEVLGWIYRWDNGEESRLMAAGLPPTLRANMRALSDPQAPA